MAIAEKKFISVPVPVPDPDPDPEVRPRCEIEGRNIDR